MNDFNPDFQLADSLTGLMAEFEELESARCFDEAFEGMYFTVYGVNAPDNVSDIDKLHFINSYS